jgi:hypothetical protein
LLSIPNQLAPTLVSCDDIFTISNLIRTSIVEALNELAKGESVQLVEKSED